VAIVPADAADAAISLLGVRHLGAARIGSVTGDAGRVALPALGLAGDAHGLVRA
jgi:hypothetical protein